MVLADIDFGGSIERAFDTFFEWLPALIGALAILIIGYFVAKIIGGIVRRVLEKAGLDRTLQKGQTGQWITKVTQSPSRLLGRVAFWALFLGVISLAVSVLGIQALEDFVAAIYAYLPNVIAALLIFIVAGLIAGGVAALVARTMGETTTGKVIGTVAPVLIMAIAGFMILDQLQIAPEIVTITYASLMGAVALGMALAFGLGGREVAARMLEGAYEKGQESAEQVKQDVRVGKERAQQDVDRARERAEGDDLEGPRYGAEQTETGRTASPPRS